MLGRYWGSPWWLGQDMRQGLCMWEALWQLKKQYRDRRFSILSCWQYNQNSLLSISIADATRSDWQVSSEACRTFSNRISLVTTSSCTPKGLLMRVNPLHMFACHLGRCKIGVLTFFLQNVYSCSFLLGAWLGTWRRASMLQELEPEHQSTWLQF